MFSPDVHKKNPLCYDLVMLDPPQECFQSDRSFISQRHHKVQEGLISILTKALVISKELRQILPCLCRPAVIVTLSALG